MFSCLLFLSVSTLVAGSPYALSTRQTNATEPCNQIRLNLARNQTRLDPDLALACLRSVPLDSEGDQKQLEGVRAFFGFQSTVAFLKDPTPGYLYPAVDLMGGLDDIQNRLTNSDYDNEYDFQLDLSQLAVAAHDGHFSYTPDITNVFSFSRDTALLSISKDGTSLPSIYTWDDFKAGLQGASVSPVVQINGEDVETFTNEQATVQGSSQDPDANYNSVFPIIPLIASSPDSSTMGAFTTSSLYNGKQTTLVYANGSTSSVATYATTSNSFEGVTDGKTFFEKFCTGPPQNSNKARSVIEPSNSLKTRETGEAPFAPIPLSVSPQSWNSFYPPALIIANDSSIAGYFKSNDDFAVLSIPTFEPKDNIEFQSVTRRFLATAQARGSKKLIIDLRGNGGGMVLQAYDLFRQLFPDQMPYGASNLRASQLLNDTGSAISRAFAGNDSSDYNLHDVPDEWATPLSAEVELNVMLKHFSSWEDFYGPVTVRGDNFTNLVRYNLSDILDTTIPISGILDSPANPSVFTAENIILLQDGQCASTCAVFSEFMKAQAGVKQIVVGGRKQQGPMQGVGGVKGANVWSFALLGQFVRTAYHDAIRLGDGAYWNATYASLQEVMPQAINRLAIGGDGVPMARANVRNNIREGDDTLTPLQFVYEAADCRFFYTPQMIRDQSLVWQYAYEAMFNSTGLAMCVAGSTGAESSSTSPNALDQEIGEIPPANATNFFGSNATVACPADLKDADCTSAVPSAAAKPTAAVSVILSASSTASASLATTQPPSPPEPTAAPPPGTGAASALMPSHTLAAVIFALFAAFAFP